MVGKLNAKRFALAIGLLSAISHLIWVILVAVGGKDLVSWMYEVHFITPPQNILPMDPGIAIVGILGAFIVGAIAGWLFAVIYNWINIRK